MYSDGVLVIETQSIITESGSEYPAEEAGIIPGDIIITANGKYIDSSETLRNEILRSNEGTMTLKIKRDDEYLSKVIAVVKDKQGEAHLGLWIKDSAAGLGTVSFYSRDGKTFAALGHGVCEKETGVLLPLSEGELCKSKVTSATKSRNSKVGTLNGYFTDDIIGVAVTNNETGIFGKCNETYSSGELYEIGYPDEIRTGQAQIYSNVDGVKSKYDVNIIKVDKSEDDKNMIVEISDEVLISKTGGIVQGMSGSPIVQNGKIVGVLTHVFTDDVCKGYAIFAETMYKAMSAIE